MLVKFIFALCSSFSGLNITNLIFVNLNEVCRGYGGFGALGHSVYHRELFPRLVKGSWEGSMRHIATSGTHTAAVTGLGSFILFPAIYGSLVSHLMARSSDFLYHIYKRV